MKKMKITPLTRVAKEIIELKLKVADEFIEEIIEPLGQIGSPEALIGKKYEQWTPADLQVLGQIYGAGDDSPLAKLIFERSYKEIQDMEVS